MAAGSPGRPVVLAVGGLDPTAGAGIVADATTLGLCGARPVTVAAALTTQGPGAPVGVHPVDPDLVRDQAIVALAGATPEAIKTGALGDAPQVRAVADLHERLGAPPLVVDPVVMATAGGDLVGRRGVASLAGDLLPRALVVTPNVAEAALLTGEPPPRDAADVERMARMILDLGPRWVLVTGGHLPGAPVDRLLGARGESVAIEGERIPVGATHGTGCVHASALAAGIARGLDVPAAARRAREWLEHVLRSVPGADPAPDLPALLAVLSGDDAGA